MASATDLAKILGAELRLITLILTDKLDEITGYNGTIRRSHPRTRHGELKPFEEQVMTTQSGVGNTVYKVVEVIGTSTQSWEDAAKNAVETASQTLRDLRIAEVVKTDMIVKDGKVQAYRTRVLLSFKYEG